MPPLSRYLIKTSLAHLLAALTFAVFHLARLSFQLPAWLSAFQPVYLHLLVVGWLTQLIMGVAYWMFPKWTKDQPRGHERLWWVLYAALNLGLLARVVGEPLLALQPSAAAAGLLLLSAVLQWFALWGFILQIWPRVKEK